MVQTRAQSRSPSPSARPHKRVKQEPDEEEEGSSLETTSKRAHADSEDTSETKPAIHGFASPSGDNVTSGGLPPESFGGFSHERQPGLLEKGHLYFTYRPKVGIEEAESLDDVARFQMILFPESNDMGKGLHRIIAVGRKHFPDSGRHEVVWGSVVEVGDDIDKLRDGLRAETYTTKTKGERHIGPTRLAGRGSYIVWSVNDAPKNSQDVSKLFKTYLAYHLQIPKEPGPVQEELKIQHEGVLHLQVKNPSAPSTNPRVRNQPEYRQPKYPGDLRQLFKTRFVPANPAALLNYPGAELLLISSKHKLNEVLGSEASEVLEEDEEDESVKSGIEHALKELHATKKDLDVEPLRGHWD